MAWYLALCHGQYHNNDAFVALGIFVCLAIISRNVKTFQFQISIFIIIWILGEIAGILRDSGIIVPSTIEGDIELEIQVVSMFFFSIWLRFYYSQRNEKKMIEDVDDTL
jgi:TctA family transporter